MGVEHDVRSNFEKYVQDSQVTHSLREKIISSAIDALQLPQESKGLDAGCGIGLITLMLADRIGENGIVTGLDIDPDILKYAEKYANELGLADQVEFKKGDVANIPFEDDTFDWVWSCDCVGYAPIEPLPLLNELVRVIKPGGIVAILAWSSETLLPGYPQLEANLRGTTAGISPFIAGKNPNTNFLRALGWFEIAGLKETAVHTFAGEVYAPLDNKQRKAMAGLFEMRWSGVREEISATDWEEFDRLCNPKSSDFIVNQKDYYAFFTYSMFLGTVVK